jgi:hypothetical protein
MRFVSDRGTNAQLYTGADFPKENRSLGGAQTR